MSGAAPAGPKGSQEPTGSDRRGEAEWFAEPVRSIARPWREELARRLAAVDALSPAERDVVLEAGHTGLLKSLHAKLSRLYLIELHALRMALGGGPPGAGEREGAGGGTDTETWAAFIKEAGQEGHLDRLAGRYPTAGSRVASVARLSVAATAGFAQRLAADRDLLRPLLEAPAGELRAVEFGEGDTHRGGLTVSRVEFAGGSVMYKPRPSEADVALGALLDELFADFPGAPAPDERIRVPRTLVREGYGWAEFVPHRYCTGDAELDAFYRNVGHWLAVLRFTGGTDMHAENMIAAGPVPVIVDAETLFDAPAPFPPSGQGDAVDVAAAAIRRTVLRTGLLPVRGTGFALGGVDISGVGALPGQQPLIPNPVIADGGTAAARFEVDLVAMPSAGNHPSPTPVLSAYWDRILAGFREMTAHLRRPGTDPHRLLRRFEGAQARRILRPTQAYVDIGRMLWHPASLHDEAAAVERARDILRRNAEVLPGAPTDRAAIDGEIADLLVGDVPMFTFTVDAAAVRATVEDWRTADLPLEESVIQDALVGAYLNERTLPPRVQAAAHEPHARDRERRRRDLAAQMVRRLCDGAVRGADGTATWISPVFTPAGWSIRVLPADLYTGQGGVALTLAEYLTEVRAGRADEVPGVAETFDGALRVLVGTEDRTPTPSPGAFSGAASQVWTWLALHRVLGEDRLLERAAERAVPLAEGRLVEDDIEVDLLNGAAGGVVPLLNLAAATGQDRWLAAAARIGRRLTGQATLDASGARWTTRLNPEGIGGFAHGATGIGWALTRLALGDAGTAAERRGWHALGERAFAYQESLYQPEQGNWLDVRVGAEEDFFTSWCHGSAGVGIGMLDLHRRTGDPAHLDMAHRAARACAAEGFGWSHTLCHGDLGLWEFLTSLGFSDPFDLDGELLTGLEQRGPVGGLAREAFSPSLMSGLAGVLHTLLRMHPEATLPNPLLLD
ncbi:type 2 lanthipeptide synthetase LanM family protein [Streptomyces olivochromogenes]|uniref:type 2 lanthipeptide synthetase LanM family protein n=1 Tax=Streptomyces olivochromogenes TaxID=1963 RepID=UPI001F20DC39|nr:type 2 lanthipeptide synthetase LanM family protein [Streptomyces olivochromogenes]MCF3130367.1 type 2 lantipeptide synthetase LanM family protein [Streptomyces olivochromogenes]